MLRRRGNLRRLAHEVIFLIISLSKRLQCLAEKIEKGSIAADVGTDHGYIPAWLIQNKVCNKVIASDIKAGPLNSAINTAKLAGVEDRIDFRLCAGLDKYGPDEFDAAIIAGMGGETVISILEAAPWTRNKKLIIQPQSKIPELRIWLYNNGFLINDAELVYDTGRIYLVWQVSGGSAPEMPDTLMIDKQLMDKRDALLGAYLEGIIKRELKVLKGMEKGNNVCDADILNQQNSIRELKALKEVVDNW